MDYFLDTEHHALREDVRRFAEQEGRPRVDEIEERRAVDVERARDRRAGWFRVTIARLYGGMDLGHLAKTIIIEELSRVCGAMTAMAQASQLGVAKVVHLGTASQEARWLPAFATGELLPTIAVTEPESGGHVLAMSSTAVRHTKPPVRVVSEAQHALAHARLRLEAIARCSLVAAAAFHQSESAPRRGTAPQRHRSPTLVVATSVATSRSSDASILSTRPVDLDARARSGRIYAFPHTVEGLVRDDRVDVRVLFGASREGPGWRGLSF